MKDLSILIYLLLWSLYCSKSRFLFFFGGVRVRCTVGIKRIEKKFMLNKIKIRM